MASYDASGAGSRPVKVDKTREDCRGGESDNCEDSRSRGSDNSYSEVVGEYQDFARVGQVTIRNEYE